MILMADAQTPYRLEDFDFVRLMGRCDDVAGRHRDALSAQRFDELTWWRLGERHRRARGGIVEHPPVLGDDTVEEIHASKRFEQVAEQSPGDEHDPSARRSQALERLDRWFGYLPAGREGTVEVAGKHEVAHPYSLVPRRSWDHRSSAGP